MVDEWETQESAAAEGESPELEGFAAAGECERRAGRLAAAERCLRAGLEAQPNSLEGRLVLALVLLDRGLERAARSELERLAEQMLADFEVGERTGPVSEAEIDAAMERAAEEATTGADPHRVAIGTARRFTPTLEAGEGGAGVAAGLLRGAFGTRTMAEVLERQGDARGAERIRRQLATTSPSGRAASAAPPRSAQTRAELERWLLKLRSRKEVSR